MTIGAYAFSGCLGVKKFNMSNANELNIPDGVTSIGEFTFNIKTVAFRILLFQMDRTINKNFFPVVKY